VFTSRSASLLALINISVFVHGIYVISQQIHIISISQSWHVSFNFSQTWFSWTFLIVPNKPKLKSSINKASSCFRPFWIGKSSRNVYLYVSFTHILISLTVSWMPKFCENNEHCFVPEKSICSWSTVSLCSHFFSCSCRKQESWSVVLKPTMIIPNNFMYIWTTFWERILDNILKLMIVIFHNNYKSQLYHSSCKLVQ
jgi:hypothetical protein